VNFRALPIDPADGFPQAFRLALGGRTYQFQLHANVAEEFLDRAPVGPFDLPVAGAFLVLTVQRESPTGLTTILRRKLVPAVEYHAAELALVFRRLRLDARNLNGSGSFGSEVVGGVAQR
jgi:hypothetical protein